MQDDILDIHNFWFGELDANGLCAPAQQRLWFIKSKSTDATLRERYTGLFERAKAGDLDHWADTDLGLIALIVLLDQFSRNIYRDSAQAFDADPRALKLALATITAQRHVGLPTIHQVFLYLPLEHSENLLLQEQCVTLFEELALRTVDSWITDFGRYAVAHREVIARFGRFPHRNSILGRESSPQELDYLETHGGF